MQPEAQLGVDAYAEYKEVLREVLYNLDFNTPCFYKKRLALGYNQQIQ